MRASNPPVNEATFVAGVPQTGKGWRGGLEILERLFNHKLAAASACFLVFVVASAIFAPLVAPHSPTQTNMTERLQPPSANHPLGTDQFGRDVLSRVLYGARVSLLVAVGAMAIASTLGTVLGLMAGYYGRRADQLIMSAMDMLLAFPTIVLAIAVVAVLGPGIANLIVAIGILRVPAFARVVRSDALSLRSTAFVEAARASGRSNLGIMFRHILPNALAPLIVLVTVFSAHAISLEASLSFLGLGIQPPTPSWGVIVAEGREFIRTSPHISTFGGLAIVLLVLSLNIMGDALRDATDPKLRRRR